MPTADLELPPQLQVRESQWQESQACAASDQCGSVVQPVGIRSTIHSVHLICYRNAVVDRGGACRHKRETVLVAVLMCAVVFVCSLCDGGSSANACSNKDFSRLVGMLQMQRMLACNSCKCRRLAPFLSGPWIRSKFAQHTRTIHFTRTI